MSLLSTIRSDIQQTAASHEGGYKKAPAGEYEAIIDSAEEQEYNGEPNIALTFVISDGEYEGTKEFATLYVCSDNSTTVRIAQENLVKIFISSELNPNDAELEDLVGKTITIKKTPRKDDTSKFNINYVLSDDDWANFDAYKQSLKDGGIQAEEKPAKKETKATGSKPSFLNN